jgi:hypothetical protein
MTSTQLNAPITLEALIVQLHDLLVHACASAGDVQQARGVWRGSCSPWLCLS